MNELTDKAFEKWFEKEFGETYYPTEAIKLAWQVAKQQPLKRLDNKKLEGMIFEYTAFNVNIQEDAATVKFIKNFANAIMDEMERINK